VRLRVLSGAKKNRQLERATFMRKVPEAHLQRRFSSEFRIEGLRLDQALVDAASGYSCSDRARLDSVPSDRATPAARLPFTRRDHSRRW